MYVDAVFETSFQTAVNETKKWAKSAPTFLSLIWSHRKCKTKREQLYHALHFFHVSRDNFVLDSYFGARYSYPDLNNPIWNKIQIGKIRKVKLSILMTFDNV